MFAKVVSDHQCDWDSHLPRVLFAYQTAIHKTTGFTPFHITFGCFPFLPIDVFLVSPKQTDRSVLSFLANLCTVLIPLSNRIFHQLTGTTRNCYDQQKPSPPPSMSEIQMWLVTPVVKSGTAKKFTSQW